MLGKEGSRLEANMFSHTKRNLDHKALTRAVHPRGVASPWRRFSICRIADLQSAGGRLARAHRIGRHLADSKSAIPQSATLRYADGDQDNSWMHGTVDGLWLEESAEVNSPFIRESGRGGAG